jgi:hypothetical protein
MYVLIDCTNYRALATHEDKGALGNLAYIQFANLDTVVMPCNENRPYAQFNAEELEMICEKVLAGTTQPWKSGPYQFNDMIHKCRALIEGAPHLRLPAKAADLEAQAQKIEHGDDRPYAIRINGQTPELLHRWSFDPQRNRPRDKRSWDDARAARQLHAGAPSAPGSKSNAAPPPPTATAAQDPAPVGQRARAGTGAPQPPQTAPKPPKAPSAPRAPRQSVEARPMQNGKRRPGDGSKTVVPWDVADKLAGPKGHATVKIKDVMAACEKQGCNPNMVRNNFRSWQIFHGVKK